MKYFFLIESELLYTNLDGSQEEENKTAVITQKEGLLGTLDTVQSALSSNCTGRIWIKKYENGEESGEKLLIQIYESNCNRVGFVRLTSPNELGNWLGYYQVLTQLIDMMPQF